MFLLLLCDRDMFSLPNNFSVDSLSKWQCFCGLSLAPPITTVIGLKKKSTMFLHLCMLRQCSQTILHHLYCSDDLTDNARPVCVVISKLWRSAISLSCFPVLPLQFGNVSSPIIKENKYFFEPALILLAYCDLDTTLVIREQNFHGTSRCWCGVKDPWKQVSFASHW